MVRCLFYLVQGIDVLKIDSGLTFLFVRFATMRYVALRCDGHYGIMDTCS